ncbi:DUF4157 domain-containing protein [Streptomyces sp. NPDC006692]|uniref:eCIS core domain-containing protein n=1 Tax=Streptomyces sp. NPDC006692 TaxID=3364758 RepID=UPI00369AE260
MHANEQAQSSEGEKSARPGARTPAQGSGNAGGFLALQGAAGNAAVVQLLRQAGHLGTREQHQHNAGCGHQSTEPAIQRSAVHDVLRAPGRPLDEATRTDMENRLGADFSDVRIHNDAAAKSSATEVGARAYTSGSHVVLGEGGNDRHTLAHELTHVIQQRQGPVAGTDNGAGLKVSDPSDRFEREAEANARRAVSGPAPSVDTAEAVQRSGHHAPQHAESVQRLVPHRKDANDGDAAAQQAFDACVTALDTAVQGAYDYVVSYPALGTLGQLDGHTLHWTEVWAEFVAGTRGSVSKEFGYAVESLATYEMAKTSMPAGYHIALQQVYGGTRPDVVLYGPGQQCVAALDITASNSAGHIFAKDNWDTRFSRFAEITYPSLDPATRMLMRGRGNATGPVSADVLAEYQEAAAERRRQLALRCLEIKQDFENTVNPVIRANRTAIDLNPQYGVEVVVNWLRSGRFDVDNADGLDKTASCVLATLGINGVSYGFAAGYTANVARGESFLLGADHQPGGAAWGQSVPGPDLSALNAPRGSRNRTTALA